MIMEKTEILKAMENMNERFGHDTLISLATTNENTPFVRILNSYYENGAFYTITYALSNKMKQIEINPTVAICGEWFTANGVCENLGWIRDENNTELAEKLRNTFASWYSNGHIKESDLNTIIIKICLNEGILANSGIWYNIDFNNI